ncbi:MAG: hypothetical protein SF069_06300 [Phycisphaerae bacterium]|nr:hypothetical protein [Phycisphaerae bacterium]
MLRWSWISIVIQMRRQWQAALDDRQLQPVPARVAISPRRPGVVRPARIAIERPFWNGSNRAPR